MRTDRNLHAYLQGKVRQVDMTGFVYLDAYTNAGETQAMLLYKSVQADYLLINDKRGRRVAQINQIKTIGSLGVLIRAKKAGLIAQVRPKMDLIAGSQIYLSTDLINAVLKCLNFPPTRSIRSPDGACGIRDRTSKFPGFRKLHPGYG